VRKHFSGPEYEGRVPLDLARLKDFLATLPPGSDYGGFLLHERASREDVMMWAAKKGGKIDFESLFGCEPMPPFFSGKCYYVSRAFAAFISEHGLAMAQEHVAHLIGAEDAMVGRLFQEFQQSHYRS